MKNGGCRLLGPTLVSLLVVCSAHLVMASQSISEGRDGDPKCGRSGSSVIDAQTYSVNCQIPERSADGIGDDPDVSEDGLITRAVLGALLVSVVILIWWIMGRRRHSHLRAQTDADGISGSKDI